MNSIRRVALTFLALVLGGVALTGVAAPAQATDYYRYWVYFHVDGGEYVASDKGVGAVKPADGSIAALRYAAPEDYLTPNEPRIDLGTVTFDDICADVAAEDGSKRVAVLIDFGVAEDYEGQEVPPPAAGCASVPENATTLQVLQAVTEVRVKTSEFGPLLCAVDGYPAQGCADVVTQTATPADAGFVEVDLASDEPAEEARDNTLLYAGLGVLVLLLIFGGVFLGRRKATG